MWRMPRPLLVQKEPLQITATNKVYPGKRRGRTAGDVTTLRAKAYMEIKKIKIKGSTAEKERVLTRAVVEKLDANEAALNEDV